MRATGQWKSGEVLKRLAPPGRPKISSLRVTAKDLCHLDVQQARSEKRFGGPQEALGASLAQRRAQERLDES